MAKIGDFTDPAFRADLQADLNNNKDSDRKLKEISVANAGQIFKSLGLPNPNCKDDNGNGVLSGDELKCLNFIWKAYLPA